MSDSKRLAADGAMEERDFDAFYAREFRSVVGVAYALSGSRSRAEDLAQEAFVVVFRRWSEVSRLDDPGAWVRRVAVNRAVSWFRRTAAEARALMRIGSPDGHSPEIDEDAETLWAEVRRLAPRQAQVIALHYVDQRTVPEIGRILECSENTVKTHLQRARNTLARRLAKEQP